MAETRKIAAILCADVVGYSRLAGADEDRILARLRTLRSDLIDPTIAVHNGRIVKRTGDGSLIEFRSVVDAVRCAVEVQNAMVDRNAGVPPERRIEFRIGIHLGDVVEESDGDLMGDGVNIAARLEGVAAPGAICLSEDAYRQVKGRLDLKVTDLGPTALKNIAEPIHAYSLQVGVPAEPKPAAPVNAAAHAPQRRRLRLAPLAAAFVVLLVVIAGGAWWFLSANRPASVAAKAPAEGARLSIVVLPFANLSGDPGQDYLVDALTDELTTSLARLRDSFVIAHNTAMTFKGKPVDAKAIGKELGVRYVLEGSVQPSGDRMRVNVTGQIMPTNPAAAVRGPRHVARRGKTPVLDPAEARQLLDAIDVTTIIGLRDRALIGLMVYSFARIGAAIGIRVEDAFMQNRRLWVRLHEKGGKQHAMSCHHNLEAYLHAYIDGAGLAADPKALLFQTYSRTTGQLAGNPRPQANAYAMIQRRARATGITTKIGNHTFRVTGVTAYLKNGGTLEKAAQMANHASTRTTQLYDRHAEEVTLDEVERAVI